MASKKVWDKQLLTKAQSGDKDALADLCSRVRDKLRGKAIKAGVGQELDDVLQDAMVDFFCSFQKIDPSKGTVMAFARKILRDKVADLERRRGDDTEVLVSPERWEHLKKSRAEKYDDAILTAEQRLALKVAELEAS